MKIPQVSANRLGRVMNVTAYKISKKTAPISNKLLQTAEKTVSRRVLPGIFLIAEAFIHSGQIQQIQKSNTIMKNIVMPSGDVLTTKVTHHLAHAARNKEIKNIKSYNFKPSTKLEAIYQRSAEEMDSIIEKLIYKKGQNITLNPLYNTGHIFIEKGEKYGVNPAVLASIAMHESGRGTSYAARVKNNVGGIMGKKSLRNFDSVEDCIETMAKTVKKRLNQGYKDVASLGASGKYCAKSASKEWTKAVTKFLNQF